LVGKKIKHIFVKQMENTMENLNLENVTQLMPLMNGKVRVTRTVVTTEVVDVNLNDEQLIEWLDNNDITYQECFNLEGELYINL
jgi:hypothetical protein